MVFNSYTFLIFFAVAYPLYLLVKRTRLRSLWLLLISLFFYGCWNPLYPLLLLFTVTVDYISVRGMSRFRNYKTPWLLLSIVCDLGVLGFFKYSGFAIENINALLARMHIETALPAPTWLFPIGVSFFVFRSMSYTIDFHRGNVDMERNYIRYAAFVAFFPTLLAGPIERAKTLLPQLRHDRPVRGQDVTDGLSLFAVGLFKKVALADYLAMCVDEIYSVPDMYQAPALMLATFAYAWQIYFDFSGYSDMARGVAKLMGYDVVVNFNNPYLATGMGEFWNRWHISLSSWFKDYVYIPLGGNRKGKFRTYVNMFITMVLSGLWHGASWSFIIWGALHASGRVVTRELERTAFYRDRVPRLVKQVLVFLFVCFCWIFFRAANFSDAWLIVTRIFTSGIGDPRFPLLMLALILATWTYQYVYESKLKGLLNLAPVRIALTASILLYVALLGASNSAGFIYFQF